MKNRMLFATFVIVLLCAVALALHAQSGQIIYFGATAGTTKAANCGTPTVPSLCLAGDGFWIWQNSTQGWFLAAPPSQPTGVVLSVNAIKPDSTGNVTVPLPTTATVSLPGQTLTGAVK
jgi:hypothetical protein